LNAPSERRHNDDFESRTDFDTIKQIFKRINKKTCLMIAKKEEVPSELVLHFVSFNEMFTSEKNPSPNDNLCERLCPSFEMS
jgi:hypothetical protein